MHPPTVSPIDANENDLTQAVCVMVFNANDPSGASGLAADISTIASVGGHALPVVTGAYARDTAEIFDHFSLDEDAVTAQARAALEDMTIQVIKVGFVGSPDNLGAIAGIAADYPEIPLIAYMPNLSWWDEMHIDQYHDAFKELILPQTTVLVLGRNAHRSVPRRLQRIDPAANDCVGWKPQYPVALATPRLEHREQTWRPGHRPRRSGVGCAIHSHHGHCPA